MADTVCTDEGEATVVMLFSDGGVFFLCLFFHWHSDLFLFIKFYLSSYDLPCHWFVLLL